MSEIGETFAAWKEASTKKRAANRESSAQMLRDRDISFSQHNDGAHLIVYGKFATFDFWPGTGKWVRRPTKNYKRGVVGLIKEVLQEQ
jgi:hypothetical protein